MSAPDAIPDALSIRAALRRRLHYPHYISPSPYHIPLTAALRAAASQWRAANPAAYRIEGAGRSTRDTGSSSSSTADWPLAHVAITDALLQLTLGDGGSGSSRAAAEDGAAAAGDADATVNPYRKAMAAAAGGV